MFNIFLKTLQSKSSFLSSFVPQPAVAGDLYLLIERRFRDANWKGLQIVSQFCRRRMLRRPSWAVVPEMSR